MHGLVLDALTQRHCVFVPVTDPQRKQVLGLLTTRDFIDDGFLGFWFF